MIKRIDRFFGMHRFLSNFFLSPIRVWGKLYSSVEHFFQACKAKHQEDHDRIANASKPVDAKHAGNGKGRDSITNEKFPTFNMIENWDDIRDIVMLRALVVKFNDPKLQRMLHETETAELVEGNNWDDLYWGQDDKTWKGENKLGFFLMYLRELLRKQQFPEKFILTVTGHRPQKLGGFGNETFDLLVNLAMSQFNTIRPDKVITGMALGWDQAVAEACINMQIPFIAAIPTPLQSNRWFPESVKRYEYQLSKAEKVVDTSLDIHGEGRTISVPQAMQERNMWMVDRCTAVLALWDGSTGGTGNCVRYTNSKQIPIANCWNQFQRIRNEQSRSH